MESFGVRMMRETRLHVKYELFWWCKVLKTRW